MTGVLLLDELGKGGTFDIGSKRYKKFVRGEDPGILPITRRRLEILRGK